MSALPLPEDVSNFQRAQYQMMRDPRYCTIAMYMMEMEVIADDKVGTAATDCVRRIWYSPQYFDESPIEECIAALIHEVYHKFLNFIPRFERWAARHPDVPRKELIGIFNRAQDYFINYILKHEWMLPIRPEWLYDVRYNPRQYTTEAIADELLANERQQPPPPSPSQPPQGSDAGEHGGDPDDDCNGGGGPSDDTGDDDDTESDADDTSAGDESTEDTTTENGSEGDGPKNTESDDVRTKPDDSDAGAGDDIVLPEEYNGDIDNKPTEEQLQNMELGNRSTAANADRMAKPLRGQSDGDGTGDPFSEALDDANYMATHNWNGTLAKYASSNVRHGTYTYTRPNPRRRTSQGAMFPGPVGKELGTIIFAVDSSGSTSGGMVEYFFGEMERALTTNAFEKAVVIWCSDGIPYKGGVQEYTKHNIHQLDKRIRRTGYGTEFLPVFKYVAEHYRDAAVLTYLTDGGTDDYDIRDCYDVWLREMRRMPVVWALCDLGWGCSEHFTKAINRRNFGVVCDLPMDKIHD